MNKIPSRAPLAPVIFFLLVLFFASRAGAVEALLLQDTYVDNGTTGGKPPPNASNYGAGMDLRIFKGSGRIGRTFLNSASPLSRPAPSPATSLMPGSAFGLTATALSPDRSPSLPSPPRGTNTF